MPKTEKLPFLINDDAIVATNKPAGCVSVPSKGETRVATKMLAVQLGIPHKGDVDPRIRPVHRIDKDTSGVLLFAKTLDAQRALSEQFQNRKVAKEYLALVIGNPSGMDGVIDAPMRRDPSNSMKMEIHRVGKPALTHWKLLQRFRGFSLLRVMPQTGKTHQIRVHLTSIGHPLVIDPLYGQRMRKKDEHDRNPGLYLSTFKRDYRAPREEEIERPLIGRLTLHAHRLALLHPNGSPLALEAEPPKDFRAAINMLTKYAS
jgi:23S rRNA pseudouridine955/2504/2580 synthase/23S rRNA pseudouridine1911/1915/1917 synthase